MRATGVLVLSCSLIGASLASGCSNKQRIRTEMAVAKALVSDQQEAQLGLQVKQELSKQNMRFVSDPEVLAYVDGIAKKILPLASKDRGNVTWHVHVIDDPKTVNAFATPGGHLYLFTGLLLEADNEAEVAGVLSHEAGHVVARHSARQMVEALGAQTVTSLALGENPNVLAQVAATFAAQGALLANSRSDETEADGYALKYASKAGYDARGVVSFFEKLSKKEGKVPAAMVWLRTHPLTTERVRWVKSRIKEQDLSGGLTNAAQHDVVRQRLRSLSPQVSAAEPE